jgi:HPt (histidine-containing phosphotransfer) domain-containing protein
MSDHEPISREWLAAMTKRQALLRRMFAVFVREEPQRIDRIGAALAAGDAGELRFLTHGLKGSAATLGAEPIRCCCQALEGAALAGDMAKAGERFRELCREMQRAYEFMNDELSRLPAPPG